MRFRNRYISTVRALPVRCASVVMWLKFLWMTLTLTVRLARSTSAVSYYSPHVQAWAVAPYNAMRLWRQSGELYKPGSHKYGALTGKTAVWGALDRLRSLPFGKSWATFLADRLTDCETARIH